MDRKRAVKLLPIIQAFVDGYEIQVYQTNDTWVTLDDPQFSNGCEYRVKPKTMGLWVAVYTDGSMIAFETEKECDGQFPYAVKKIFMREVS